MEVLSQEFYDIQKAGAALEIMSAERLKGDNACKQLAYYVKDVRDMTTVDLEDPKSMRLVTGKSSSNGPEEAVLRIQGVLFKIILPPKRKSMGRNSDSARFLEQSITLIGCGSAKFNSAVNGIFNIAEFLSRHIPVMSPWLPATSEGQIQVNIGNRLFTRQREANQHESMPVDQSIDPFGSLSNLAGKDYVHTDDNVVRYFKLIKDQSGTDCYTPTSSNQFKPGDIVEAQCSFVVLPTRSGQNSMKLVLRALTMLDESFSKAAHIAGWKKAQSPDSPVTSRSYPGRLRRRVGYDEDETADSLMDDINKRVKFMDVEDLSGDPNSGRGR
ncbi:hypothetical protein HWV62_4912 [Athelia sp. TMB]|nr:hypothetical protein HWV62_4912 [Athelia sp. TMB]